MKIWEITDEIERFAPLSLQESYDNCGYMCGSRENEINGILLAIDITEAVVDEAISLGCNLIISHHPLIFRGIKSLSTDNYINRTLIKAIRNNMTIYAAHTNMDSTQNGVSKVMADKLNLINTRPLVTPQPGADYGLGIIGELATETKTVNFLQFVKETFNCKVVKHSAICKETVKRVALCGGAGAEFIEKAIGESADIYITGDIKHHDWYRAENRVIIADIGHYESEQYTKQLFYNIVSKKITNFAVRYSKADSNPVYVL